MKVLAVVHDYVGKSHGAGAETTLHSLLAALVQESWDAEVIISRKGSITDSFEVDGVRVTPWVNNQQPKRAVGSADVVISHLDTTEQMVYLSQSAGKPMVHLIHNDYDTTLGYLSLGGELAIYNTFWVQQSLEGRAAGVVPISSPGKVRFRHITPDLPPGIVVHPAVSPEKYRVDTGDMITLVNLWDGDGATCGKGQDVFYWLAEHLPQYSFLGVHGGYGKQVIRDDLKNVSYMENTPDIREVLSRTKVLLVPSRYESFGRIAAEAMCSGIPVVATPTPGLTENLGIGGVFADRDKPWVWLDRVQRLMSDPDYYEDCSWYSFERANYWDYTREAEIEGFVTAMGMLATEGRME